jgi:hypothetical protein
MDTTLGIKFGMEAVINEGVLVEGGDQINRAALATVTAGGTSARYKFLPAEGHAAIPAVARFYADVNFINKHFVNGRVA